MRDDLTKDEQLKKAKELIQKKNSIQYDGSSDLEDVNVFGNLTMKTAHIIMDDLKDFLDIGLAVNHISRDRDAIRFWVKPVETKKTTVTMRKELEVPAFK